MSPVKLTLIRKLLIGFSVMVLLIIVTGGYVIWTLQELRSINKSVVQENLPAIEATHRLTESLLAQDLYEKRYDILRDPAAAALFVSRGEEFQKTLDDLRFAKPGGGPAIRESVLELHRQYQAFFREKQVLLEAGKDQAVR